MLYARVQINKTKGGKTPEELVLLLISISVRKRMFLFHLLVFMEEIYSTSDSQ